MAAAFHIIAFVLDIPLGFRYTPFYGAILPFSMGIMIYFTRGRLPASGSMNVNQLTLFAGPLWCSNIVVFGYLGGLKHRFIDVFYYSNLVIVSLLVFLLSLVLVKNQFFKNMDKLLGDISYPIFLLHWIIGFLVASTIFNGKWRGLDLMLLSVPIILGCSYLVARVAHIGVEPLRIKVRERIHNR